MDGQRTSLEAGASAPGWLGLDFDLGSQ